MPNPTSPCIGSGAASAKWTAVVRINSADVSSQVVGTLRIDAEESAARIADITLCPPTGTVISLPAWVGLSVQIDVADNSSGSPASLQRLFTGVIDTPTLDQSARTLRLACTDDLQGRCAALSNAALDALITGGYASPAVFDATATGWTYAQDRLSTTPKALDVSPTGTLRVTPWAAKTTADLTMDADILGENSLVPQVADRAGLINEVVIDFGYRFPRLKAETHACQYDCVTIMNFAQYQIDAKILLQRAQIESAIQAAGGTIESISFVPLPNYVIPLGSSAFWTPGPYDYLLCMGFTASVSFDYAQTTEEQHTITVRNALSVAAVGTQRSTLSGALEGVYPDLVATETGIRLFKADIGRNPPTDVATPISGKETSVNATLTAASNRAAANAAMEVLIAMAKTRIVASHRKNRVSATVPLIPAVDVDKTVQINADGVAAKGKCTHVTHELDPSAGLATSQFSLALCALSGVGVTHAQDPTTAPTGTSPSDINLATGVSFAFNNSYGADGVLTITFPQVSETSRNNNVVEIATTIAAPIDEDLFTVTI